jgi:hypothetical protein
MEPLQYVFFFFLTHCTPFAIQFDMNHAYRMFGRILNSSSQMSIQHRLIETIIL